MAVAAYVLPLIIDTIKITGLEMEKYSHALHMTSCFSIFFIASYFSYMYVYARLNIQEKVYKEIQ